MIKPLPAQPNLLQLKNQAKDLLQQFQSTDTAAASRFREHHPRSTEPARSCLADAQLVIAREYGFASWPKLKHHVESLEEMEAKVSQLRGEFAVGDRETRRAILERAHSADRWRTKIRMRPFSLKRTRLLIANHEGYAFWDKYESFLHLDPDVREVIVAVRQGDIERLRQVLRVEPDAANPKWVPGFERPEPIPNDSVPLHCVSEAVFLGINRNGNEGEITQALIDAGALIDIEGDLVYTSAISFNALRVVEVLLDRGAAIDGVDKDGVPMAYALHFGFTGSVELLGRRGAALDLRFAAGLGDLEAVKSWFRDDGALKPGAGRLADPFGFEAKLRGEPPQRCARTRTNILSQALYFACVHRRFEVAELLLAQGVDINAIVPGLPFQATVMHRVMLDFSGATGHWGSCGMAAGDSVPARA